MSERPRQEALEEFVRTFPTVDICPEGDGACRLLFEYSLNAEFADVPLAEDFGLEMLVESDFPNIVPSVRETTDIIPPDYEHLFLDGTFCLGINGELVERLLREPSLIAFLQGPVASYLYTALFHRLYGRYPYGDRPHGAPGIIQFYSERLEGANDAATLALMEEIASGKYRGKAPCPCGSGKATRSCHGSLIRPLMTEPMKSAISQDHRFVADQLAPFRKQRKALSLVDARLTLPY